MHEVLTNERVISTGEAISEGLAEAAVRDPSIIFLAEGVEDPSAVYGTLKGIGQRIGSERMIEMPLAENGMCGVAIGAAMTGKRPVISFHRVEFALLAMEQIVNNAAKTHYVSNGQHAVPLVLRLVVGRGWGQGPAHSQSFETMFAAIPGLKVIMPVFAGDAKGMMAAAVADGNPVISIESRWAHYVRGHVPEGYYTEPLDGPRRLREGDAATVVATSYMTLEAMRAVDTLVERGVAVDLFDLRVLRPLNLEPIRESVRRTGRLLTVDTGFRLYGAGAEIAADITEHCFASLKAAPRRLGLPEHPTPSSRGLVANYYPDARRVVETLSSMLDLSAETAESALESLIAARGDLPIDVPDQFFRGPF